MNKNNLMLLVLFFIGLSYNAKAQVNDAFYNRFKKEYSDSLKKINADKRDMVINNAEFIFEGKVIRNCLIYTDSGFVGYNIVQIEKIYRGYEKLKFGNIEVLVISEKGIPTSHENNIIFCKGVPNVNTCYPNQIFDNTSKVVLVNNLYSVSPEREELAGLFDLNFTNYEKARNFLSKYPNINITDKKVQEKK